MVLLTVSGLTLLAPATTAYAADTTLISGVVWLDVNRNGVRDDGESGIPWRTLSLWTSGADGQLGTADDPYGTNFETDEQGSFQVSCQTGTSCRIGLDSGPIHTYDRDGGNDGVVLLNNVGADPEVLNFGVTSPTYVQAITWDDINKNGLIDTTPELSPPYGQFTVELRSADGTLVNSGSVTGTSRTRDFMDVTPGDYYLAIPGSEFGEGSSLAGWVGTATTESVSNQPRASRSYSDGQGGWRSPTFTVAPTINTFLANRVQEKVEGFLGLTDSTKNVTVDKKVNGVDSNTSPGIKIRPGDPVSFTYRITNNTRGPVYDLTVVDSQEGSMQLVKPNAYIPGVKVIAGANAGGSPINPALRVGEVWEYTVTKSANGGDYSSSVTVRASQVQNSAAVPIAATDSLYYQGAFGVPDFSVTAEVLASPPTVGPGDVVVVSVTPANTGEYAPAGWTIESKPQPGLETLSMAGANYSCSGLTCVATTALDAGAVGSPVLVVTRVSDQYQGSSLSHTALVSANQAWTPESDTSNNESTQSITVTQPAPPVTATVTATATATATETATVEVPGPVSTVTATATETATVNVDVPGPTTTATATETVKVDVPGPVTTVTATATETTQVEVPGPVSTVTATETATVKVDVPGPETTVTATATATETTQVEVPGPVSTVTATATAVETRRVDVPGPLTTVTLPAPAVTTPGSPGFAVTVTQALAKAPKKSKKPAKTVVTMTLTNTSTQPGAFTIAPAKGLVWKCGSLDPVTPGQSVVCQAQVKAPKKRSTKTQVVWQQPAVSFTTR